jgi:alpha-tubulin suppressor-like RCC1 family protein
MLALTSNSPCVDSGSNSAAYGILADITGGNRVVDGDGVSGADVDMGAYEYDPSAIDNLRIAGGEDHTLLVLKDKTVWACGSNADYVLGNPGISTSSSSPVIVPVKKEGESGVGYLGNIVFIDAGLPHSLAVDEDGYVWAWGENNSGELGDGTYNPASTPVKVVGGEMGTDRLEHIEKVAAGRSGHYSLACDSTSNKNAWAWGKNDEGQLGVGSVNIKEPEPTAIHDAPSPNETFKNNVVDIDAGIKHSIALEDITNGGNVWTFGQNEYGSLGINEYGGERDGPVEVVKSTQPIDYLKDIIDIAVTCGTVSYGGSSHAVEALSEDGHVWSWGLGTSGQLGNGEGSNSSIPVQVVVDGGQPLSNIIAISGGLNHVLALDAGRHVWAWGNGALGGTGGTTSSQIAIKVRNSDDTGDLENIIYIDAGYVHSTAIDADGNFWTWGGNGSGQLGLGHISNKHYPQPMIIEPAVNAFRENAVPVELNEEYNGYTHLSTYSSVWYSYTPPDEGYSATISLDNFDFAEVMSLYEVDEYNTLQLVTTDAGSGSISRFLYGGTKYLIKISGYNYDTGKYTFKIE